MHLSARHPWIIALLMGMVAFPVAGQTGDPVNDPGSPTFDPLLGASVTVNNGGWTSGSTLMLWQGSPGLTTYSTPLTVATAPISVDLGLMMSTSSTTGTSLLAASSNPAAGSPDSTINLGSLVYSMPLSSSTAYLSPVVSPSSTSTPSITASGSLVISSGYVGSVSTTTTNTLVTGGSLSTGTIMLGPGTMGATTISSNTSIGTSTLSSSLSSLVISSGTVSLQSPVTLGGNLDLQSNGTLRIYLDEAGGGAGRQATVLGDVTLSGDLAVMPAATLPTGSTFVILNKISAGPITGTFAGRPQGSVVNVNGNDLIISYTGGDGNDVTLTALSKAEVWRHIHFGTIDNTGAAADNADADGDGIPNLLERACHLDPTSGSAAPFISACKDSNLEFTYTRSLASVAAGDVFTVEWCDTLGTGWSSSGVTEEILSDDGTVQSVKAIVPAGSSGHRFMRLKVTPGP